MIYAIRYFFIILCSVYAYIRILNISARKTNRPGIAIFFSMFTAVLMQLLSDMAPTARLIITFLLCYLFLSCYTHTRLSVSFTVTIISFALSYITLAFAGIILSLFTTVFSAEVSLLHPFFMLLGGFLQFLFIYRLFRIRRFQNGMPFLYNMYNKYYKYKHSIPSGGMILSLFVMTLYFMIQKMSLTSLPKVLLLFSLLLLATAVICWWRRKITQSYIEKLRASEVESLYEQVADKEREIEKLKQHNDSLARIIHKDNKLIPAMEMAVEEYLNRASAMTPEEAVQYGMDLLTRLQTMSADRKGILEHYREENNTHPQIGLCTIDAVLSYMEKRARSHNILCKFKSDKDLKNILPGYITEADVSHLLSDALENAIQANVHNLNSADNTQNTARNLIPDTTPAASKEILIHMGILRSTPFIDISDTGIPFDPTVYQDFGNQKHTTHASSGGSGIGLTDIWDLKNKYKFSIHIYEYPPDNSPYTKRIRFLFDHKNHFLILSYRSRQLNAVITRSDLHVFPWIKEE